MIQLLARDGRLIVQGRTAKIALQLRMDGHGVDRNRAIDYLDLSNLDLSHMYLKNQNLNSCDLTNTNLQGCDLRGVRLCGCIMIKTDFRDAQFDEHMIFDESFQDCIFGPLMDGNQLLMDFYGGVRWSRFSM